MSTTISEGANQKLVIKCSRLCEKEKSYIFEWVFTDILGIRFDIEWVPDSKAIEIWHSHQTGFIDCRHGFFSAAGENWLSPLGLPVSVEQFAFGEEAEHPPATAFRFALDDVSVNERKPSTRNIEFDLFGSLFFLLSRYEEVVVQERDSHDRFPSGASVLSKFNLLDRPIANEYIELLWTCLVSLWPTLKRKKRDFRTLPSHDIDVPSAYWRRPMGHLRESMSALKRGRLADAVSTWKTKLDYIRIGQAKRWHEDPNDEIDWLMEQSESIGAQSAFYYIPEKTHRRDPGVPINHPHVLDQWQRIANRGHEIGLHPGYDTYLSPDRITQGAQEIRRQMDDLKISQDVLGGRQHFLRWKTPDTAIAWDQAELDYDSTLSFADRSGFRCGVCYEYPMYDLINREPLQLKQRPLVVMDCTVTDDRYMGLGLSTEAFDFVNNLKSECRKHNGDFTLLWHNTEVISPQQQEFYQAILTA